MVPISNVALGTLTSDRLKNASGLFNLTRNLGGAVGLAVINTILTRRDAFHYERLAEHVDWGNPEALAQVSSMAANFQSHGIGDGTTAALASISNMTHQQAWLMSFIDVFYLLTLLFAFLAVFAMLMRKLPAMTGGGGGH